MKLPKLFQETSLFNTERTVEASIRLLSDSITSMVAGIETYTDPNGDTVVNTMGTLIRQTIGNVLIQATKNASTAAEGGAAVIDSLINVATDGVTISASKVNIEGATLFTSGRLSTASLNNAYDAKGSAATEASNAIANLSVGGRNLARNSKTTSEWKLYTPNAYNIAQIYLSEDFVPGQTYTVTIWGGPITRSDKSSCWYSLYWGGGNFALGNAALVSTGIYRVTFTVSTTNTAQHGDTAKLWIYNTPAVGASGTTYSAPITKIKVEIGNKATDWTPAPEDLEAQSATALSTANSAVDEEQYIYIQAVSGTNSVSGTSSWITATGESTTSDTAGLTPVWTTKRPTYRSNYPVIFVAKQKKTVGGTVTCSIPVKDDTLTVIDGGHVTTGTIDASKATITNINASNITTGTLDASKATITNINASNINSGTLNADRIGANSISFGKFVSTVQTSISNGDAANTALKSGIGGRNLVKNATAGRNRTVEFSKTSTTATSGYQDIFSTAVNRIEGTNKYIVSFEAKSTVATTINCYFYSPNTTTKAQSSTGQSSTNADGACQVSISTSWARYWVAWEQSDIAATDKSLIVGRLYNDGTAKTLTIRAVKMETGSVATDWSPNPTLVDSDITSAATTASNYITKIDNNGIKIHADNNATTDYTQIDANGMEVFKSSTSVAKFGETTRVGKASKGFTEIGVNSNDNGYIDFYNGSVRLAHIGYDAGTNAAGGISTAPYYDMGTRKSQSTIGNYSFVSGDVCEASGFASSAEGYYNTASGGESHAEGLYATASGLVSHAEGYSSTASGDYSHAEGYYTTASGGDSHTEGSGTTASGEFSHAEGHSSTASGTYSHAEGESTSASASCSHAHGWGTIADQICMTAIGRHNRKGVSNVILAVGNGNGTADSSRRNAFTVIGTPGSTSSAYVNGTATSNGTQLTTSDERVKTLIEDIPIDKALQFIQSVTPRMYYKDEANPKGELGFYAQEVEKTVYGDQLVTKDNSGMFDLPDFRVMTYEGFIAPMVAVLQHLIKENELLKDQNDKLQKRVEALEYTIG